MTTKRRAAPAATPDLAVLLRAVEKVDRTVLEFQQTTGQTLERLLPMTEGVREAVNALSARIGKMESEIEAVKRRVFALERAKPPEVLHADAG